MNKGRIISTLAVALICSQAWAMQESPVVSKVVNSSSQVIAIVHRDPGASRAAIYPYAVGWVDPNEEFDFAATVFTVKRPRLGAGKFLYIFTNNGMFQVVGQAGKAVINKMTTYGQPEQVQVFTISGQNQNVILKVSGSGVELQEDTSFDV